MRAVCCHVSMVLPAFRLLAAAASLALFAACTGRKAATILPDGCRLKAGDVVFRLGNGLTSRAVLMADGGGTYSHVGIVVDSCGTMMIVHAVPGEPDYEGDPDRVKMETPEKFFISVNASKGEVRRFRGDPAVAEAAARCALSLYERGVLFDHDYDDADTTKMYCCELVEHSYRSAGRPLVGGARHSFSLPGLKPMRCILPSDLRGSDELELIVSF